MSKRKSEPRRPPDPGVHLIRQPHGGALLSGNRASAGGRHPEAFRAACREVLHQEGGLQFIADVMTGRARMGKLRPTFRERLFAAQLLIENGYGKAPQKLEVETGPAEMTWDEAMATLVELAPKMLPFLPAEQREVVRQRIAVATEGMVVRP